ncbi:sperm mitochondrial-associated cysteine-rich protein [Solenopsis invicta]|uniref:sperm mitochondrial-associated cysteine-rich protein n=1 Tax=Solenopsis invicta TaxID=13686 RepID=UPI0001FE76E0|nr:sperm mitochondrial-associated cysteine-rich protein [Solenopsis invicta]
MSIIIRDMSCKKKSGSWNDMDELKYLICAIDCSKCPSISPPPSHSIILPPRIEEIPCEIRARRPPCVPPPRCCPIIPGPCCPWLLTPSILPATLPQSSPNPYCNPCRPCGPLPCLNE